MSVSEDPYKALDLDRTASQDDIRLAYRRLAKQHHPDLNPGNKPVEERLKSISAANEILSDVARRGQGGAGPTGAASGDALIEIHVLPHRYFRRQGDEIHLDLPISLSEAVLGGPVEVPTPGGPMRMRIPPHSDNGAELRLRGRGMPAQGGQPSGDLYARLVVVLGPPDQALSEFLRSWTPAQPYDPRQSMRSSP